MKVQPRLLKNHLEWSEPTNVPEFLEGGPGETYLHKEVSPGRLSWELLGTGGSRTTQEVCGMRTFTIHLTPGDMGVPGSNAAWNRGFVRHALPYAISLVREVSMPGKPGAI